MRDFFFQFYVVLLVVFLLVVPITVHSSVPACDQRNCLGVCSAVFVLEVEKWEMSCQIRSPERGRRGWESFVGVPYLISHLTWVARGPERGCIVSISLRNLSFIILARWMSRVKQSVFVMSRRHSTFVRPHIQSLFILRKVIHLYTLFIIQG